MIDRRRLTIGVVQLAVEVELAENRDKIVRFVGLAKERGCRVVVFPEGALNSPLDTPRAAIDAAIEAIRAASAEHGIYVVLGLLYRRTDDETLYNRLLVFDPAGRLIHDYNKLWADTRHNRVPGCFVVDGVPCNAAICSDRWIRAVEELPVFDGSRIIFEISNNHDVEWMPEFGWYWYVPRAIRNQVFVVFCNSARQSPGRAARLHSEGHGHSAIIAPDGRMLAAAGDEADRLVVATVDLAEATATEALRRRHHPIFKPFWDVGLTLLQGRSVDDVPRHEPPTTPEVPITLAAGQIACTRDAGENVSRMIAQIRRAKAAGADLVAFPELALTGALEEDVTRLAPATLAAALDQLRAAARETKVAVAFGAPFVTAEGRRRNAAFVIGADGALLTRYDQLVVDRLDLFEPGRSTRAMWFALKGVPAVITIGSDARWSELAELAGGRGAGIHVHLAYDADTSGGAALRRKQLWINLASYYTFTATVNAADPAGVDRASAPAEGGSAIWHDFRPTTNHRREIDGRVRFCALPVAEAGAGEDLLVATQIIPPLNLIHRAMVEKTVPVMRPWYDMGAMVMDLDLDGDGDGLGVVGRSGREDPGLKTLV